ncbi:hypothetical protein C8J57DRAFT_1079599 [Mycena rebaudengoi]|nr:hypothetical protein C8J57DRAFT_1079599 [Mycena rebaudengoi]
MAIIFDIPNEILLEIIPFFCLKSLIAGRGVCKEWKELILRHIAINVPRIGLASHVCVCAILYILTINGARRSLLRLYTRLIRTPTFLRTRPWTLENLQPFDRQGYIDALLSQHNDIPEDFCIWILEWPAARAAINCSWPGLPATGRIIPKEARDMKKGFNFLGRIPPLVHTIRFNMNRRAYWDKPREYSEEESDDDASDKCFRSCHIPAESVAYDWSGMPPDWVQVPALLVYERAQDKTWLVLDTKRSWPYSVCVLPHDDEYPQHETAIMFSSWISWLKGELYTADKRVREGNGSYATKLPQLDDHVLWTDGHDTGRKRAPTST